MEHSQTSLSVYLCYGAGTLANAALGFIVNSWLLYFYLPPQGQALAPAALYGLTTLTGYALLAFLNPWVGYRSDNLRSAWGRRLPFLLAALLPVLVFFVLLWTPPVASTSLWNLAYLTLAFALFKAASSFYLVPHQALLADLAASDRERVRFSTWQAAFLLAGFILGGLAGLFIEALGYRATAWLYAGLALPGLALPLLIARPRQEPASTPQPAVNFNSSLLAALGNRTFVLFAACWGVYMMTTTLVQAAVPFIATEICLLSRADTVQFYLPAMLASLACYPLVARLSDRFGKRRVFAGSLLASAVIFPGVMLVGSWLPLPIQAQCVSWVVLQAVAVAGVSALGSAFVADIAGQEALASGQRREGMYFAVLRVFDQLLTGVATLALPLLLLFGRSRSAPNGPLGVRLVGLAAGGLALVAFILFLRSSSWDSPPKTAGQ